MSLITELKRRNVFRMAILYVVGAWLILQVGDLLFDLMGLPDWALRIVLGILILGFPVALVFSWLYELTPEGLKLERDVDRTASITPETAKKLNAITLVVALIAIGLVVFQQVQMLGSERSGETPSGAFEGDRAASRTAPGARTSEDETSGGAASRSVPGGRTADGRKSIAVLPFDNFSEDAGNAFFASGVHEDVLTNLSKIDDLKVISRTSVEQYSSNRPPVSEIAAALGVGHIVEGSVRRAGDRVRVTAQLIDASTDEHLWAESFDRDLTDVFAIQTEIAKAIATALEATLSDEEEALISQQPTTNMSAYDLYLRAREAMNQGGYGREKHLEAESLAKQAIALDPNYALAHALLAKIHGGLIWFWDRSEQRMRAAREAAERAMALNPDLPESRAALADYYYRVENDYERAIRELEAAHEISPSNAEVLGDMAVTHRRLGHWQQAVEHYAEAHSLDPANVALLLEYATTLIMVHDFERAIDSLDPMIAEYPGNAELAMTKAWAAIDGYGHTDTARRTMEGHALTSSVFLVYMGLRNHLFLREWDALQDLAEDPTARATLRGVGQEGFSELMLAAASEARDRQQKAEKHFHKALELARAASASEHAGNPYVDILVAGSLTGLGRPEEALALLEKRLQAGVDPIDEPAVRLELAIALAKAGQEDAAIDELEPLLQGAGRGVTPWSLKLDPRWDFLRGNERFQELTQVEATIR